MGTANPPDLRWAEALHGCWRACPGVAAARHDDDKPFTRRLPGPADVIGSAVWLYHCFSLSPRDGGRRLRRRAHLRRRGCTAAPPAAGRHRPASVVGGAERGQGQRGLPAQKGEVAIAVTVLNTMIRTAKPVSVRIASTTPWMGQPNLVPVPATTPYDRPNQPSPTRRITHPRRPGNETTALKGVGLMGCPACSCLACGGWTGRLRRHAVDRPRSGRGLQPLAKLVRRQELQEDGRPGGEVLGTGERPDHDGIEAGIAHQA